MAKFHQIHIMSLSICFLIFGACRKAEVGGFTAAPIALKEVAKDAPPCTASTVKYSIANSDLGYVFTGTSYSINVTLKNDSGTCAADLTPTPTFPSEVKFKDGTFPGTGGTCKSSLVSNTSCTIVLEYIPTAAGKVTKSITWQYKSTTTTTASANTTFSAQSVKREFVGLPRSGPTFSREPLSGAGFSSGYVHGTSVAISGNTMVVGGEGNTTDANGETYASSTGAAFVYVRSVASWSLQQKIVATGDASARLAGGEYFGRSVAIYNNTIVVGAPFHSYDENGANYVYAAGAAYVYTRTGSVWSFKQKLVGSGTGGRETQTKFGQSVTINGSTIAVGSTGNKYDASGANSLNNAGAVFVFTQSSSSAPFVLQQKIAGEGTNGRNANDAFGTSISLDTDTLAVGAPSHGYDETGGTLLSSAGAVFVYLRTSGVWALQQKLAGSVGAPTNGRVASDFFGTSVSLSGNVLAVGAPGQDYNEAGASSVNGAGALFTYSRSGVTWTLQQKIVPTGANARVISDGFGKVVSLSGNLLAVGVDGQDYDAAGANLAYAAGAVFVYYYNTGSWGQEQRIVGTGTNGRIAADYFGYSVAIDGTTLATTSPLHSYDENGQNYIPGAGASFVFTRSGVTWSVQNKLLGTPSKVNFIGDVGFAAGLSIHKDTMVVTGHRDPLDENSSNYLNTSGAAYIFVKVNGSWVFQQKIVAPSFTRALNTYFSGGDVYAGGNGVGVYDDTIVIGTPNDSSDLLGNYIVTEGGAAYVYTRSNGVWSFQQKLIATGTNARVGGEKGGHSVAISGDTIVMGTKNSNYDASGNSVVGMGGAYVFKRSGTTWTQEARLAPTGTNAVVTGCGLGSNVAIDGDEIAVAAKNGYDADGANLVSNAGTVFMFRRSGSTWTQVARLVATGTNARVASNVLGAIFGGNSLALSGNIMVASSTNNYNEDGSSNTDGGTGAAFVFEKVNGTWAQTKKIVATGTRNKKTGFAYSVATDGTNIVLASYQDYFDENEQNELQNAGAAYVYRKVNGAWTVLNKIVAHGTGRRLADDRFGKSVGISGSTIVVGSPNNGYSDSGHYVNWAGSIISWDGLIGN